MEENINQIFELKGKTGSNRENDKPAIPNSYINGFIKHFAISIPLAIISIIVLFLYFQDKASTTYGFGTLGIALEFITFSIITVIIFSFLISIINMIIYSQKKYNKAVTANLIILVLTIIVAFIIISLLKIKYGISFWGL